MSTATLAAPRAARRPGPAAAVASVASRFERLLEALLTPLDAGEWTEWRDRVHALLRDAVDADTIALYAPVHAESGVPPAVAAALDWHAPHVDLGVMRQFREHVLPADVVEAEFVARGLRIAHQSTLIARDTFARSLIYNEWVRPHGQNNCTLVRVDFGGAADARLWVRARGGSPWEPDPGQLATLRAAYPALRAGLGMWRQLGVRRGAATRVVDALDDALVLLDGRGATLHENAAFARLAADEAGPDVARLRDAARQHALILGTFRCGAAGAALTAPAMPSVRTARHAYALTGTVTTTLFGATPVVCVAVRRQLPRPLTDGEVRARYGLTPRELQVARLLADGLSNDELAHRLGVAWHTARNHVERALAKLALPSRARVGPLLRNEGP